MASRILPLLIISITASLAAGANVGTFFNNVGLAIKTDIEAGKSPVETIGVSLIDTACAPVKGLFGFSYADLASKTEPALETLKLMYRDANTTVFFNLSTAAVDLPAHVGYNPNKTLIIFCHGFISNPNTTTYTAVSEALLATGNTNVLALDASVLFKWLYLRASTYVRYIGETLGGVLAAMVENESVTAENIYIIGHSLGAQVAGFTGKTFAKETGTKVGRITALDPAGPCFAHLNDSLKVESTDAEFVDVIHSDAGILGIKQSVGHVDFWPNSGTQQPNCLSETCSHGRSWQYYAESVLNITAFPAVRCNSWSYFKKARTEGDVLYMGYGATLGTSGDYYLQSGYESPYGLGEEGMTYSDPIGVADNIGDTAKSLVGIST